MPRQDVPYGGAICRLKERIAEIWDELGKKLHSINGVEGDGAGDVKIVSGDAAITITDSPAGHYVEIGLDHGNLPSAAVSSVNGQTGAVVLDASDINVIGGSDVETDLANLDADLQQAQSDIAQEALARANADSTLQGNINTLSASIPTAAATAVANDPTVAQLSTDVPNKVDKITSGSSLKAYTHTGATQGETSVVDGTAANSIGIRDANGRMQAADPAGGATDKTLVTANWVSQTGDSSPNNLLHKSGNETKTGLLTLQALKVQNTGNLSELVILKNPSFPSASTPPAGSYNSLISFVASNDEPLARIRFRETSRGVKQLWIDMAGTDGTLQSLMLIAIDADNNIVTPWS